MTVIAGKMAGATGLEPAASGVTGRRSNQLSYAPLSGMRPIKPCIAAKSRKRTGARI